jgi:hypothetical protein
MFCQSCGAENADDAVYCRSCGAQLQVAGARPPGTMPGSSPYYSAPRPPAKSPVVAAILNLFFGIGYWYLGYRKVLTVPTTIFIIIALIIYLILGIFTFGILELLLAIILAIDGYQKGQGQKGFIAAEM